MTDQRCDCQPPGNDHEVEQHEYAPAWMALSFLLNAAPFDAMGLLATALNKGRWNAAAREKLAIGWARRRKSMIFRWFAQAGAWPRLVMARRHLSSC